MTLRPPEQTFVRSDTELFSLWKDVMGRGGFAQRSLWMIFFEEDGRTSPLVVPIDDLPTEPDEPFVQSLARILESVIETPVRSAALLLSRPGPGRMTPSDRLWARALRDAIDPLLVPWPLHLATADRLQVFAPDDLIVV